MKRSCFLFLLNFMNCFLICAQSGSIFLTNEDLKRAESVLANLQTLEPVSYGGAPVYSADNFEGDIKIDERQRSAVRNVSLLWPEGRVPYEIDPNFNATQRAKIAAAFIDFHRHTCIEFVGRRDERGYMYVSNGIDCSSLVGYRGRYMEVSLADNCFQHGVIIHELLHTLGFWHEQSRTDRDDHVLIVWDNIPRNLHSQFEKYRQDKIQHLGEPYDYGSVMHYGPDAFSFNGEDTIIPKQSGVTVGQRMGFSDGDIRKVNKLYKCATKGDWLQWNSWTTCSVSCGSGLRYRQRTCSNENECLGQSVQRDNCSAETCTTGDWLQWSQWTTCSVSCGSGLRSRQRICSRENECLGQSDQRDNCSAVACTNGDWLQWSQWTTCSVSCGVGLRSRQRICSRENECLGQSDQRDNCSAATCTKVTWLEWNRWTTCTVSCGLGLRSRQRTCSRENECLGQSVQRENCSNGTCTVSTWSSWGHHILLIGGEGDDRNTMEVFNPENPSENRLLNTKLITGRFGHVSGVLNDGSVITAGGNTGQVTSSSVELHNFKLNTVKPGAHMETARECAGGAVMDGVFYVCGGKTGVDATGVVLNSCEKFFNDRWESSPAMLVRRSFFSLVALGEFLFAIGGFTEDDFTTRSVERFDFTANGWSLAGSMKIGRGGHAATVLGSKIFVCGGLFFERHCERYDSKTDDWQTIVDTQQTRYDFSMVTLGGTVYIVGGFNATVEKLDPQQNSWKLMEYRLKRDRASHSAVVI